MANVKLDLKYFIDGRKSEDPTILARLLTLAESSRDSHQKLASEFLKKNKKNKSFVLGVSGTPGAGKSSLINSLGLQLLKSNRKLKIAVIAIDPSSEITGGSILGDKTRMGHLALEKNIFIRPVSSKGSLGGITPKLDIMLEVLKCWNFNLIIIETVGVGQSEAAIWPLVNSLMLVVNPNAGDDLQAMKRGLLEFVDIVCVNKSEGENKIQAEIAKEHYQSTLSILQHKKIPVFLTSTVKGLGLDEVSAWIASGIKLIGLQKSDTAKLLKVKFKLASIEIIELFNKWQKENYKKLSSLSKKNIMNKFGKFLANYK